MNKDREAYHGRPSRLVRWQQVWALAGPEEVRVIKDPFYIVSLQKVDRKVFESVVGIFHSVFQGSEIENNPNYETFIESVHPRGIGFKEWWPYGKSRALFEATMVRGRDDRPYVRFKAFSNGGSASNADIEDKKREEFRKKVDEFLLERNLAVRLSETHEDRK
nr:hypothetical protein [Candidatus Levybacteria bacterium]